MRLTFLGTQAVVSAWMTPFDRLVAIPQPGADGAQRGQAQQAFESFSSCGSGGGAVRSAYRRESDGDFLGLNLLTPPP